MLFINLKRIKWAFHTPEVLACLAFLCLKSVGVQPSPSVCGISTACEWSFLLGKVCHLSTLIDIGRWRWIWYCEWEKWGPAWKGRPAVSTFSETKPGASVNWQSQLCYRLDRWHNSLLAKPLQRRSTSQGSTASAWSSSSASSWRCTGSCYQSSSCRALFTFLNISTTSIPNHILHEGVNLFWNYLWIVATVVALGFQPVLCCY